jgi:N-formylglutamate amidohydrolase
LEQLNRDSYSAINLIFSILQTNFALSRGMKDADMVTQQGGFALRGAENPEIPVLLSVPHAGRDYPQQLLDKLRVNPSELIRLEDRYADRLVQHAISQGITAIIASKPRAWIDLNRNEQDIDTAMVKDWPHDARAVPSAKSRGGLGLIPRRLPGCGELWKCRHLFSEVETRINDTYRPFHAAINRILEDMHRQFGVAILLDIHSMPPLHSHQGWNRAEFVVGDRFGQSAGSRYAQSIISVLAARDFKVALNHPYPGDQLLKRHGRPENGIHAIQIEIDRSLYLDELLREPTSNVPMIGSTISEIAFAVSDQAGCTFAQAAE